MAHHSLIINVMRTNLMSQMKLYITNKNYSSWSLRVWLAMKVKAIPFEEELAVYNEANHNQHFYEFSPSKKVPTLKYGELTIWESMAILEFLAETFSDKALWPKESKQRAWARAISNEMHAGFMGLRSECPMNIRRAPRSITVSDAVKNEVKRIEKIWSECLEQSEGPFLFGEFTIADAMFAPVVNRLETYQLSSNENVLRYTQAIKNLPAWQEWETASKEEPWHIESEEF